MIHVIYIIKLLVFYVAGRRRGRHRDLGPAGVLARLTVVEPADRLPEGGPVDGAAGGLGVAGSWGPLAGKFKPMTGGILFWARPGTIRLRPWQVGAASPPVTAGPSSTSRSTSRCWSAWSVALVVARRAQRFAVARCCRTTPPALVSPALLIAADVLLVLIGLRDKTIFLAARGEQYLPALIFFTVLPFTDMIVALKLLIVVVWVGAGILQVRPALRQRGPADGQQQSRRCRSSGSSGRTTATSRATSARRRSPTLMAHGGGTFVEIVTPLVLLFSHVTVADAWPRSRSW